MQESDKYRETKIARGALIDRIKNCGQKDWMKALDKLGVIVSVKYGRGSHVVAYKHDCPPEDKRCVITVLHTHLHSDIQRDIFKKVLTYGLESGLYGEDDIWKALGVKVKGAKRGSNQ